VPTEEIPRVLGHPAIASMAATVTTIVQMFRGQVPGHGTSGGYAQTIAEHGSRRYCLEFVMKRRYMQYNIKLFYYYLFYQISGSE
jgi:hypothetical protein